MAISAVLSQHTMSCKGGRVACSLLWVLGLLTELDHIHTISQRVLMCFVLWMNQSLSKGVAGGAEQHGDVMLGESSTFLSYFQTEGMTLLFCPFCFPVADSEAFN